MSEISDYKFVEPEEVSPSHSHYEVADKFLEEIDLGGYEDEQNYAEGLQLIATMLAMADETLADAPLKWRFSADLGANEKFIVMLAQKQSRGISKDLVLVDDEETALEMRDAFMATNEA